MLDKEAYLIAKIESSEKKFAILHIFSKIHLDQTHFELIDDKLPYDTVD